MPAKFFFAAVTVLLSFSGPLSLSPYRPPATPGPLFASMNRFAVEGNLGVAKDMTPATPQFESRQDPSQKEMQDRMLKEANKKRQQDIREETDKLFQLATELKAAVDKSNENMLSLDVVRKADEVEKLAKKVKDKMKEAIGPPKGPEPPPRQIPNPYSH